MLREGSEKGPIAQRWQEGWSYYCGDLSWSFIRLNCPWEREVGYCVSLPKGSDWTQWDELFLAQIKGGSKLSVTRYINIQVKKKGNSSLGSAPPWRRTAYYWRLIEVKVLPPSAAPSCSTIEVAISSQVWINTSPLLSQSCKKEVV